MIVILSLIVVIFTGCKDQLNHLIFKDTLTQYEERTMDSKWVSKLILDLDMADINIIVWNKPNIKFETTKLIRGRINKRELNKYFSDFNIRIESVQDKVILKSKYTGNINNIYNRNIQLKVYIPYNISLIDYKFDLGNINFENYINADIRGKVNIGNIQIKGIKGHFNQIVQTGNIKVFNGTLKSPSSIKGNILNVYLKTNFEVSGKYDISTNIGNIELITKDDKNLYVKGIGNIKQNDFKIYPRNTVICLKSKMGSILAKKLNE